MEQVNRVARAAKEVRVTQLLKMHLTAIGARGTVDRGELAVLEGKAARAE